MNKSRIISYGLTLVLGFHLLPTPVITNIFIGILSLFICFDKNINLKVKDLISEKSFWVLLIPFLVYALSIIHTNDLNAGLKEIEKKLSLLIFPIVLGLTRLEKADFFFFLKSSVFLISFLPLLGFINQWEVYNTTNDSGWLYNDNLVSIFKKQAVYYALFINTSLLILIYLLEKKQITRIIEKTISIISLMLLLAAQYLLASRTSILITIVIIACYLSWLAKKRLNVKQSLILIGGSILFVFIMLFTFPKVMNRYKSITNLEYSYNNPNPINHFNGEIRKENWNGFNTRLALWSCALELIKEAPLFGHGLGDVQHKLSEKYQEKDFILALKSNYNSHNQFLDILLSSGLSGLALFLFFLMYFAISAFRHNHWLLFGFLGIFALSCLTENILNRNQGIVFIILILKIIQHAVFDKSLGSNKPS